MPKGRSMTLEEIYYIGQTVAVVMTFASLIWIGVQLRHITRETRLASLQWVLVGADSSSVVETGV